MNVKTYLNQYKQAYGRVRRYEERLGQLSYLKAITIDGLPRSTKTGKPTELNAIKLADIRDNLKRLINEAELTRQKIADEIEQLEDPRYKELLFSRYIMLLPWEDVTVRVSMSCRPNKFYDVKHISGPMHYNALKEFERRINEL